MKNSKQCIFKKNCKLIKTKKQKEIEIIELDEETIVINNANNDTLYKNCNNKVIQTTNNTLIHFENCTIGIDNNYFTNTFEIENEKTLYEK